MKKEVLKDIITNFHISKLRQTYERNVKLPVDSKSIITVIGVRRSGKTHLLYETIKTLIKLGVDKKQILYLNFEDERIELERQDLDLIIQAYMELYPGINMEECYFFFDEIQNIDGWEKFVRRIFDTISNKIYITGSNSKLISSEIATALRGRTISFTLYPLSFDEYLRVKKINPSFYGTEQKINLIANCKTFMFSGGFPEVIELSDDLKIKKLQDYFDTIIYKDIIERFSVSQPTILKLFLKKIYQQVTKPFSVNKLYNDFKSMGYKVSNNLLYEYSDYIQATFAALFISKFDYSELKQIKSEKKIYSVDNGMLSAISFAFSADSGKLLENMIATEMLKHNKEIFYYKNGYETDFIMKGSRSYIPIQVSYSLQNRDTKQREVNALVKTCNKFRLNRGIIVSFEEENEEVVNDIHIKTIPCYKFMLQDLL